MERSRWCKCELPIKENSDYRDADNCILWISCSRMQCEEIEKLYSEELNVVWCWELRFDVSTFLSQLDYVASRFQLLGANRKRPKPQPQRAIWDEAQSYSGRVVNPFLVSLEPCFLGLEKSGASVIKIPGALEFIRVNTPASDINPASLLTGSESLQQVYLENNWMMRWLLLPNLLQILWESASTQTRDTFELCYLSST